MKTKIQTLLTNTLEYCFEKDLLPRTEIPGYVVEIPNHADHGHFATNLPMTLASVQKRPPREIAATIVEHLQDPGEILEKAETAGPGFINFTLRPKEWHGVLSHIVRTRDDYGRSRTGNDEKVLVEFVSANPTGPLHLGHGRGAALGDTLCRILSFCGYDVVREFYINDAGQQIRLLGESIFSRFRQITDPDYPFPENGYHGDYVSELARTISADTDLDALSREDAVALCARRGKEMMLREIRRDLSRFRVDFDVWASESELHESGLLQEALDRIRERGELYEQEGAQWIKTSDFGDDKDRVIRKQDGQFTYFASDIAYHLEKHRRGFTRAVNIWGADHHGYVPRINAALSAHGIPDGWLSVLLIQLVKLWEGGREIRMSKRTGDFVTLRELMEEVGVDAVRFVFLTKNHDSPLDFDIDLVKRRDSDNPVYYVQYGHARICSIFRKARSLGLVLSETPGEFLDRLILDEEIALIRRLAEFPPLVEEIARTAEPHRLTYYLTDLAAVFHRYFNLGNKVPEYRVITDDREVSRARLCLADGVRIVIRNGLALLGINAPESM